MANTYRQGKTCATQTATRRRKERTQKQSAAKKTTTNPARSRSSAQNKSPAPLRRSQRIKRKLPSNVDAAISSPITASNQIGSQHVIERPEAASVAPSTSGLENLISWEGKIKQEEDNDIIFLETKPAQNNNPMIPESLLRMYKRLFETTLREKTLNLEARLEESKSKVWCVICRKEACYFFGWNAHYCSEVCVNKHLETMNSLTSTLLMNCSPRLPVMPPE